MATCHDETRSFLQKCVLLLALFAIHVTGREICDKTKCGGVLKYYDALGCTPVYKNPNDCCAESYNCTHLDNLSRDKCYVNGHEYSDGETLRSEHANPCDVACKCMLFNDEANFVCAGFDCAFISGGENCFHRSTHDSCCPNTEPTCLKEGEKRATCEVDGKVFLDGEYFSPKSDPSLDCYCMPGYAGENIEPFCKKIKHPHCSPLFTNHGSIRRNCAPVFYDDQNPRTDCSYVSRCQNSDDVVIHNHDHTKSISEEEDKVCKFGNMTMHIGDELDKGSNYDSLCVKCVCEVPPIPTCRRLPDSECDADLSCQNTKQTVGAIYTRTNFVTLKYVTDSWGTLSNGFRLVITAVKDPKHTCKDFRCTQNEFCIERDLLCDGVNHCGDESDEATSTLCANSEASTILGMQTIWFVIALVFLILSVAGLVTAAVLCFCRQRAATPRHPHNAHNAQTHPPVSFPLQQMYGSNGASAGLPMGMTTLKSGGALGSLGTYGSALGSGVTGATTLPRPGNWLRPAGLRHGHSAARVRLYCQAK